VNPSIDLLHAALAIVCALLYLASGARQLLLLDSRHRAQSSPTGAYLALAAVAVHLMIAVIDVSAGHLSLGFYKVASLIFLTISVVGLATMLFRPLHLLVIVTFPLAALSVLVNVFAPATDQPLKGLNDGLVLHIAASLVAFGVLTLTTLQGALVSIQTQRLRKHHTRGVIRMLPPLDMTERMFYELLTAGTVLLTIAIVAGGLFIDDLLGQKLVHKTVLTTLAWLMFSITLGVHWLRGWRIGTAVTLVSVAFGCLTVGFFGSKLVVELIL
jgi:ABC-type uncharacterized transport system permease subunit